MLWYVHTHLDRFKHSMLWYVHTTALYQWLPLTTEVNGLFSAMTVCTSTHLTSVVPLACCLFCQSTYRAIHTTLMTWASHPPQHVLLTPTTLA